MSRRLVLVLTVALGAGSWGASAQEPAPPGRPEERAGREEALRMVDAYIVSNLQESLGLTDEQFVKVLPLVKKLQTDRREYFMGRMRALREMRRLLSSGSATEPQILDQLKELKALDAEGPAKTRRDVEALDAVLGPMQQAKYRVLEVDVERRMRELMGRARPARPEGRTPRE